MNKIISALKEMNLNTPALGEIIYSYYQLEFQAIGSQNSNELQSFLAFLKEKIPNICDINLKK